MDDITGLYDHGARSRNPISTLWYGVDPLWEKYPGTSPYNYCAGNSVILVDVDGKDIDISVMDKWNNFKEKLNNKIIEISQKISDSKDKLSVLDPNSKKYKRLQRNISNEEGKLSLLKRKQTDMKDLEEDHSQIYSMRQISGPVGYISMENNILIINYFSDDNFFHESTHATQYKNGDLAFVPNAKPSEGFVFRDLGDELCAYMMEYAYSGTLTSDFSFKDVKSMNYSEKNIQIFPYKNLPEMSVGKNTYAFLLRIAYPKSTQMHTVKPESDLTVGQYINNVKFHQ